MSLGALFIITIPTSTEELNLRNKLVDLNEGTPLLSKRTKSVDEDKLNTLIFKNLDENNRKFQKISPFRSASSSLDLDCNKNSVKIDIEFSNVISSTGKINEQNHLKHVEFNNENFKPATDDENIQKGKSQGVIKDTNSRRNNKKKNSSIFDLDLDPNSTMEEILKELLKKFKIDKSSWTKVSDEKSYQIVFTVACDEKYEQLILRLNEWGIGDREGSSISILNCSQFNTYKKECELKEDEDSSEEANAQKQSSWNRFMNSMNARLNVAQIVRDVRQDAAINFDFIVLVISAAILASFGLVENSTIFLASSMLVSPLMGPIIAAIFGTVIKDNSLRNLGVKNEFFGIFLATFIGFCFGLIVCMVDRYGLGDHGLTTEMLSRSEISSIVVGILAAIPSGAAAAIAVLGGNIGSLVGVAISASLLPPAVNSGLIWALSCVYLLFENDSTRFNNLSKTSDYSDNQAKELAILGLISMCISITNVICVYVMGIIVLRIKEIAPSNKNNGQFWKHDIRIARNFNKSSFNDGNISGLQGQNGFNFLKLPQLDNATYQNTWSPAGKHCLDNSTLQDLEKIYFTVHRPFNDYSMYPRSSSLIRQRRNSMPFDLRSPKQYRNSNLKGEQLEKISEGNTVEPATSNSTFPKKSRKFTITPVQSEAPDMGWKSQLSDV